MPRVLHASLFAATLGACGWGSGTSWVAQSPAPEEQHELASSYSPGPPPRRLASRTLGVSGDRSVAARLAAPDVQGRSLGTFRNTYYDFPNELEFSGEPAAPIMSASCKEIARVPRAFHDTLCVQGSGRLKNAHTVSFAKRDCPCAEVCPRTGHKICFEELDSQTFPWGRGAAGKPITPLRTVAADTSVLPMGTPIYIPELDGLELEEGTHDGCFVVMDRGAKVQGEHVDIFTGSPARTARLNEDVPSNTGVTVIVDAPRCARLAR
jgi:3D (Asp-Asp-Asp) domain-containing protein